nr:T9SS type A sorting domain-containing protein [Bacteroidota bacterium]
MKKVYLFFVLMLGFGVLFNANAQRTSHGDREKPSQHTLNVRFGDIVYDQSADEQYGGYIVSQFFTDTASADLSSECADDFEVPAGETWTVGSFGVWGTWWTDSPGNPEKIDIYIYEDDGGKPALDPFDFYVEQTEFYAEEWIGENDALQSYYNFTFPTPIAFTEGHYWISFQVHDSYDKVGQWGWEDKTNENWDVWHWRNPGGGFFGGGTNEWQPSTAVTPFVYSLDTRFTLYGESYDNDLAALTITSPVTGVLTATETVTMTIKNQGSNTQTAFDVAFSVDGGAWAVENVGALEIAAEGSADYTFTATADLSASGFHAVAAKTMLIGDEQPANDEAMIDIVNYGTIYPMVNHDTVDVTTCSGTFCDMGGVDGGIVAGDNGVITFYPGEPGNKIMLDFFGVWDISHTTGGIKPFRIFDGPDLDSPLIGEWTQNDWRDYGLKPGIIKALGPTGALTIRYACPTWDNVEGWTAIVSCYTQPDDDFAVTHFIIDPTLVFTDQDIELTATIRNIGAIAQDKDVTFYADDVPVGTVNSGTVNPTESTTVTYVHQFTTFGDKVIKAAVPEDSGEGDDNWMTVETFVYLNGWFIEYFDDGYFPPTDWTPGPSWSGVEFGYEGAGAMSYVETFMEDTLVTPLLTIHDGDVLTFVAKTSNWWPGNMKIVWKDAAGGPWQLVEYVDLGFSSQYLQRQVDVSVAAGISYLGFVNVGDVAWSWGSEIMIDNVIGVGIEFFYYDYDMKMVEFNPSPTPTKNEPIDMDVIVKNNGLVAMADGEYTVKIMEVTEGGDVELASVPGIAANPTQEKTHTLSITFDKIGPTDVYAVVVLNPDQNLDNNTSILRPLYVQAAGTSVVQVGEGTDESWQIPNPLGQASSVSEVIYSAGLVNPTDVTGFITGMAYQFNNYNSAPTLNVPIMIYVGETDETNLGGGFINGTELTKVAETNIDLQMGLNQELYIPFTVPYDYQGGNLCVMFYKSGGNDWFNGVNWIGTNTGPVVDSTAAYTSYYTPPIDPNNLGIWIPNYVPFMPNTAFYIADVGTVPLTGVVTDEATAPVEGALVEVVGFENSTLSLANGSYGLTDLLAWESVIQSTKFGYYDNPQTVVLYEGEANTFDFTMTLLPVVTVNAVVVGNDDPMHYMEDAEVTFEGYYDYATTVGADGTFSIPGVYGDKTYTLTITMEGYETYVDDVDVMQADLDLGTIALTELMLIPFYTQAVQVDPGSVLVNWNSPLDGVTDVVTYEYYPNNGYNAELGEEVWIGNIFEMEAGTITAVSMSWSQYGETSGPVRLDLMDDKGDIFYSSEVFETVHDAWITIDIPNITFEGGIFYTMIYWDGLNPEMTDWLTADAYDVGIDYAYYMYPYMTEPELLSTLIENLDITMVMNVDIVTDGADGGRYNEGYNIFLGPWSDINNSAAWTKVNDEPVMGNEYLDHTWPQPTEGWTYGVQSVYSTGVSDASFALPMVNTPGLACDNPWGDVYVTALVHTITVPATANPNIYGEPLEPGDWVGVFYIDDNGDEACGGTGMIDAFGGAVVLAYGDDATTTEKDGFDAGEKFIWRMFACNAYIEYPAGATYDVTKPNQGNFADFGLSKLTSLEVMVCQYYSFTTGWNSISSYITPFDADVEVMFAPIVNELTIMRNLTSVYWPGEEINTIGDFNNGSGYALKVTEDLDFEICGPDFTTNELTLAPGWYYMPSLSACMVNTMDLFGNNLDDIVIIQDLIGSGVFWPAMGIYSLEYLEPGKAYKIKVANEFTITFPECDSRSTTPAFSQVNTISTPWGDVNMTPASQVTAFMNSAMVDFVKGDVIGVFGQDNNLNGFMQYDGMGQNQSMILFGDDATTIAQDGFTEGEAATYKLYRTSTGEEFTLEVEYDQVMNISGNYYSESFAAITKASLDITGVGTVGEGNIEMYPNPTRDMVMISLSGADYATVELVVFDTKGQVIIEETFSNEIELNVSSLEVGVYFVKIKASNINEIRKLVIR